VILGITQVQFDRYAHTFTEAARRVLGDELSPHLQECLLNLISTIGKIILDGYDEIKSGIKSKLKIKNGNKWVQIYAILKPTQILFYREPTYNKKYSKLHSVELQEVEEYERNTAEKSNFDIVMKNSKTYSFQTDLETQCSRWIHQLDIRLRALNARMSYFGV